MADKRAVDPACWERRRRFGVAGGPDEIVLTEEGKRRAFAVGSRAGPNAPALEALSDAGGSGRTEVHIPGSARWERTALGRFYGLAWLDLIDRGLVARLPMDAHAGIGSGVRLTAAGASAVKRGREEQASLLARCIAAHGQDAQAHP